MRAIHPAAALCALAALLSLPGASHAQDPGAGENITPVKNLKYPNLHAPSERNAGTDIEFATIGGREYAFAGAYGDGIQIVDITDPRDAKIVATWDCGMSQADVQVFKRDDLLTAEGEPRWFLTSTHDDGYTFHGGACVEELGRTPEDSGHGTFIAEVTDPLDPKTLSFVNVAKDSADGLSEGASHNATVHPGGKFIYNSNADLITSIATRPAEIEVISIEDPANPKVVGGVELKPIPASLGTESHDITFSKDGKRAYTAALSHTAVLNTEDPAKPTNIGTIVDPAINVHHQADPVTITDPVLGKRTFLVVEDEVAGALGTGQCPNGGVHVYDITGPLEQAPVKVGYWNIDTVDTTSTIDDSCTAHVFRLHEEERLMTIAYYNGGVRVVDLSGLVGVALGQNGVGMKELGWYRFDNANVWSVKANAPSRTEPFFLYANDHRRGLDVFEVDLEAPVTRSSSSWMTPAQQLKLARQAEKELGKPKLAALCLLQAKGGKGLEAPLKAAGLARKPFAPLALGA
jgi:hypothetical protein